MVKEAVGEDENSRVLNRVGECSVSQGLGGSGNETDPAEDKPNKFTTSIAALPVNAIFFPTMSGKRAPLAGMTISAAHKKAPQTRIMLSLHIALKHFENGSS
ncbi:MAG: hypothetical protein FWC42_01135 [Proteobacteria bacterium]|nr:hypothetical protein [Pseudomonadota bacterium]